MTKDRQHTANSFDHLSNKASKYDLYQIRALEDILYRAGVISACDSKKTWESGWKRKFSEETNESWWEKDNG